ncbi:MAG: tetratricopeptide repeat protein [Myxococcales bacterium]|nr:tetratricopeptide repeat protein [Myxococcales bacterium]
MTSATSRWGRAAAVGGLVLVGALVACADPNKPESEAPSPSEDYEDVQLGATPVDASSTEDPDLAAKQAAAQEVLKNVKDRDPEEEKKKLARSHAISEQAGQQLAKGQMQEAVQTARQALKVHEQNVDAMLVIAQVYYKQGKFELVHAVTSSALQIDAKIRTPEETSRAYNLQGFAMMAMGDEIAATQSFKKAAEVDENNAVAWNNLGTRYLDAGDTATAMSCFEYALQLDARFPEAHLNHGAALRANRQWEPAEAEMRKALELRPNYAEAYFDLGVLYLDADPFPNLDTTQRLNKAIQNLGKYRELAIADGGARPGRAASAFEGPNAPPPRVSKDRADDYIRVAKKGLEREQRRIEREQERQASPAKPGEPTDAGAGEPADAGSEEPGDSGEAPPDAGAGAGEEPESPGEPATPTQPSVQGPSTPTPTKPSPQGPSSPSQPSPQGPSQPSPQGPSSPAPSKPSPQGPTTPAPTQPTPTQPAPTQPAKPSQPAPTQPAPTQPPPKSPTPTPVQPAKPSQPAPQGPGSSPAPSPPPAQKPSVQKPQSARTSVRAAPKKISLEPASRGTRSDASTLNSLEVALATSSVDLASVSTDVDTVLPFGTASTWLMVLAVAPTSPFAVA